MFWKDQRAIGERKRRQKDKRSRGEESWPWLRLKGGEDWAVTAGPVGPVLGPGMY